MGYIESQEIRRDMSLDLHESRYNELNIAVTEAVNRVLEKKFNDEIDEMIRDSVRIIMGEEIEDVVKQVAEECGLTSEELERALDRPMATSHLILNEEVSEVVQAVDHAEVKEVKQAVDRVVNRVVDEVMWGMMLNVISHSVDRIAKGNTYDVIVSTPLI